MHKQTIVDQIEITRDGTINLRLTKEVVDDDGTVLSKEYHRAVYPPDSDLDAQMAVVNEHLVEMKCAPVVAKELTRLNAIVPVVWTQEVREAYAVKMAAAEAAKAERLGAGAKPVVAAKD